MKQVLLIADLVGNGSMQQELINTGYLPKPQTTTVEVELEIPNFIGTHQQPVCEDYYYEVEEVCAKPKYSIKPNMPLWKKAVGKLLLYIYTKGGGQ